MDNQPNRVKKFNTFLNENNQENSIEIDGLIYPCKGGKRDFSIFDGSRFLYTNNSENFHDKRHKGI
jgi:hypothetical protein